MSVMIPILDTQHKHEKLNNDNDLWDIIQEQRIVIQELQKALNEVTLERDQLLIKAKNSCTSSVSSSSSSSITTEENSTNTTTLFIKPTTTTNTNIHHHNHNNNNNKLPIPPPRSPYRSNIDTQKTLLAKSTKNNNIKNINPRHSSSLPDLTKNELQDRKDDDDHVQDVEQDELINIKVDVKSIHTSSLVLSIINKKTEKELWKVEKSFTDLLSLDIALNNQSKIHHILHNTALVEQRIVLIQDYFFNVMDMLKNDTNFTLFCLFICKNKAQRKGFLTKRGKYNVGGGKKYYFIMNGAELKYFNKSQDQLYVSIIPFTSGTRIGKQTNTKKVQQEKDDYQHAFIVLLEPKDPNDLTYKHILCAESDLERDEWVKVLHSQQCTITKKAPLPVRTTSVPNKKTDTTFSNKSFESALLPKVRSHTIIRSNSDTSMYINDPPISEKTTSVVVPKKIRQKTYQRSSLDDQAILRYYEATKSLNHKQQQQQSHHIVNKASVDSLPSESAVSMESDKKKKAENRKTFWSRRKFFSSTIDPNNSLSSMIVNNNSSDITAPSNLYSGNLEGGYSTSSVSTTNTTAMFQVFGVPLDEAIRLSKISDNFELPAIVYRCIEYLETKDAVHEEGIYRLSGSSVQVSSLRQQFCEFGDVDILAQNDHQVDVHVVAGLLKMWLRELPVNVLTNELLNEFMVIIDLKDKPLRIKRLGQLVSILPIANYSLLRTLVAHLIHIVHNSEHNKMTLRNISIVFAPTLSIPAGVFTLLMSEFEYIFWTKDLKTKQSKLTLPVPPIDNMTTTTNMSVHPTTNVIKPKPSTSADRFKEKYLKSKEGRSSRNSLIYKNNVPMSIISLEDTINKDKQHRKDLILAQNDIEENLDHEDRYQNNNSYSR